MELKPGYKQTEVGVIPEEWEAVRLDDTADVIMGQSPAGTSYNRAGVGVALINGPTEFTEKYPIKIQWTSEPTKLCRRGDILLCVRGSSTGRFNISDDEYCIGRGVAAIRAKSGADTPFIIFQVESAVTGILALTTGSTFPNIDGKSIRAIQIPLPPHPEQRAIAGALGDVDALLGALTQLIAKKRDLKQAAMQQLLTGQTRLPGFSGEWELKRLGNIADIQRGASPRPIDSPLWYDSRSTVGWVRISDIAESDGQTLLKTQDYLSQKGIAASRFLPTGSLIMSICATVGRPVITGFDTCIHDGFVGFSNLRGVDKRFLFYKLTQLESKFKAMGQTGSQANLNTELVNRCEIGLPEPSEQTAIAAVLSDMDAEIAVLERRLAKTRALKQGMMQELLTGKTRLI